MTESTSDTDVEEAIAIRAEGCNISQLEAERAYYAWIAPTQSKEFAESAVERLQKALRDTKLRRYAGRVDVKQRVAGE